jgi:uncharacterized membrane protein
MQRVPIDGGRRFKDGWQFAAGDASEDVQRTTMKRRIASGIPAFEEMISLGLVVNLFLMRPAALGQTQSSLSMLLSVALGALYLAVTRNQQRETSVELRWEMLVLCALLATYWLYIAPLSVFLTRSNWSSRSRSS